MRSKLFKKLVSSVVIACLLFSSYGAAMAASTSVQSDIKGHWAEAQISAWMEKGLIKGYEDGSFKPGNQITRAEFMALINRSFGFTEQAAISFRDVPAENWAYPEIAKAVKAGYITGYADGTVGASKPISRQEVAAIVDRLLGLSNSESAATAFTDSSAIAGWAKGSVDAAVAKGILKGYTADNSFKPGKSITRAEAVVALDRAVAAKVTAKVTAYNTAGTYGPVTGTQTINGDVAINVADVTLQNVEINGKLLFAAGIGSGDAFLNNVTVKGDTTVNGGGVNSLHFRNSTLAKVMINAAGGPVRVVAEGSTTVALVDVASPVVIQEDGATGTGFGDVTLNKDLPAGSDVVLKGTFDNVVILGDKAKVELPEGTTITKFKSDTDTIVTGKGTIATAELGKDSKTTFETKPAASTIDGKAAPAPTTTSPSPTPTVVQKGTVTGSVYSNISQNEIVGAAVSVYSGKEDSGTLVGTVESGPDGKYSMSNVPVGKYYLKFSKTGYADSTVTPANDTVSVNATTDASRAYMYGNMVKGYAKDSSGSPLGSLEVQLYNDESDFSTITKADGSLYFYDVPSFVVLTVSTETYLLRDQDSPLIPVIEGKVTDVGTIVPKSRDKKLSALTLTGITLDPEFSPDTYDYTATVQSSVTSTEVTATMNAKATAYIDQDGKVNLFEGHNNYIDIYVHPESGEYYSHYTIVIHRESGAEQLAAIAKIEAVTDSASAESISISDLNTATGLDSAVERNLAAYRNAIVAAAEGQLATVKNISDLVDNVNYIEAVKAQNAALAKIKAVTDLDSANLITISDLNAAIMSDTDTVAGNIQAYRSAILAVATSARDDAYEIYVIINKVNAIAKIEAVTDSASAESISLSDLDAAIGYGTAWEVNLAAYRSAIKDAAAGALDTPDEIAALVTSVNAAAAINAVATIEAFDNTTIMTNTDLINLLTKASLSNNVYSSLVNDYRSAIIAADVGALDTSEEIANLVASINNSIA